MDLLKNFLERYKHLTPKDADEKKVVISIIQEMFEVELKKEDIDFRNGLLYLKISPAFRGEILMNKWKILGELHTQFGRNYPLDIK